MENIEDHGVLRSLGVSELVSVVNRILDLLALGSTAAMVVVETGKVKLGDMYVKYSKVFSIADVINAI